MTSPLESLDEGSARLKEISSEVEQLQARIEAALARFDYSAAAQFAMRLSIEEAVMNGFRHGNRQDASKFVEVRWSISAEAATFHVIDEGEGFDPESVPDPTLDENIEIPSGRGLMLIRAYMTEASYHGTGNHLEMTFRKRAQQ
ncbi:MAG: ATP-binding protein [Phycisphaerales bacterium]|nr:ATP-binding protein [Phycisphaerales bacterium]